MSNKGKKAVLIFIMILFRKPDFMVVRYYASANKQLRAVVSMWNLQGEN